MRKRALSTILAFMLVLGLFPATAFAAEGHWAQQAVDKLNGIYGDNVFTASDDAMTEGDAYSVLQSMGSTNSVVSKSSTNNLTRGKACTILTEIFHISVGNTSAIQYLYEQNIINGKSESDLDETGTVTKAQFAVLTYRVLNFVGGGMAESTDVLKPGTEEFFAWMYLAARRCVPFAVTSEQLNTTIASAAIQTYVYIEEGSEWKWVYQNKSGQNLWDAWVNRLDALGVTTSAIYNAGETLIAAAMRLVKTTGAKEIFTDVSPGDWWYDGVIYLFNESIIQGQGDGRFGLEAVPRFQLAVLLARIDEKTFTTNDIDDKTYAIRESIKYVIDPAQGYMSGTFDTASDTKAWNQVADPYWGAPVTRAETVVALLKQQEVVTSGVNTAILDRFSDSYTDEATKEYMAYAVSHGLIDGTGTNTLSPNSDVARPQIGVLAYRVLVGLDKTKMQDYRENISFVMPAENAGQ